MDKDQEVDVTFFNSEQEFEFVEVNEEENQVKNKQHKRALESQRKKSILVKSNEGTSVKFLIRSLKIGSITIKVTAVSPVAGDGIEMLLIVEPEGVTQFMNEAVLIDLRNMDAFRAPIEIVIPIDAVSNSTKIEAAITGDILGPSIENLDKLM